MNTKTKSVLHNVRKAVGRVTSTLSVSLYPRHIRLIRLRERELNLGRSYLTQTLFDIEEREGLPRRELEVRLNLQPPAESPADSPRHRPH